MIIRSQDKKDIFNFDNLTHLYITVPFGELNKFFINTNGYTIATYSTEEKAIKVLDMICDFANEKHYEKVVPEQCGFIGGIVFPMPDDEEVEV